ncbi:MAG: hypothetical protein GXY06_02440 [Clostridiaceae bacterium]|nr:hypothetical protein [Clostridiaceae bacterium]
MAFISMFFLMIVYTVVLIGLIFFLIAAVMDIVWIVRSARKKKTHIAVKILAVLMSIVGFVLFVFPVSFILITGKVSEITKARKLESIENKIYPDEQDDKEYIEDFEFNGMNLVRIDFVIIQDDKELEMEGALVIGEYRYYSICRVENERDFDIYVLKETNLKYCEENQLQAIYDYYYQEAELNATISYYGEDRNSQKYECDFDKDILFEIRGYYDTKECDYSGSIVNEKLSYRIIVESSDGLFYESISLSEIGDDIVLDSVSSGGEMRGITLPEDKEEYVRSQIGEWTDLY